MMNTVTRFRLALWAAAVLFVASAPAPAQEHIFFDGGPFYDGILFEESFAKGRGPLSTSRTIPLEPGSVPTVRVFLRNGGPPPLERIRFGRILLNGETLFGAVDFFVRDAPAAAVVSKEVELAEGDNDLTVELRGFGAGTVNVLVLQASALPAQAVLVSPGGQDLSDCGGAGEPCGSISFGLERAIQTASGRVLVANGVYLDNVVLPSGIDLLGGFASGFLRRDVEGTGTILIGTGPEPTLLARDIVEPTLVEGFVIQGPTVSDPGTNSVAIYVESSSSALVVRHNRVFAGVGGPGARGQAGGDGLNGADGLSGAAAVSGATTTPGGAGGAGAASGGSGGTAFPPAAGSANGAGQSGVGVTGGRGGAGGVNSQFALRNGSCIAILAGPTEGVDGEPGQGGANGAPGSGGRRSNGGWNGGAWITAGGLGGTNGAHGGGGGGGGAGAGAEAADDAGCPPAVTGPSGGGGGAGGSRGLAGTGGGGGGASFGVFVAGASASPPNVADNLVHVGAGGDGGSGGLGGRGGSGGTGRAGGLCDIFGCGPAGSGGSGGEGGHGGGGGGGAGGDAVGIFSSVGGGYETVNTVVTSTGSASQGGEGGLSLGFSGERGEDGLALAVLEP